ncbi:putative Peptidase S9 prolyl oligopeptidase active site protein [Candidatus Zixiibacteriota bacterium]|nr:putative Peptidase S9 prolyl oligopeptidase active site protein [candidate division Zixibacteria bacterium]
MVLDKFLKAAIIIIIGFSTLPADTIPPSPRSSVPDITTFMKIGSCNSPDISPDGRIFFISSMSGTPQLYGLLDGGWPYQLTTFDDGIDWYALSHDGSLAVVGVAAGGSEQTQLYLVNTAGGNIRQLTNKPDVQYGGPTWRKDGTGFYFRSNEEKSGDFRLYFYNLTDGATSKVCDMGGTNYIAGLSPDEQYLLFQHTYSNSNNELYMLELKSGKAELLTPHKDEALYLSPYMKSDNSTIYLISNANKEGILKRAILDVPSKKVYFLDPDSHWTIDGLGMSENRKYMYWLANEEGYSRIYLQAMEGPIPLRVPTMEGLISSAMVNNGGNIVFAFTDPVKTQDIWFWDWRNADLEMKTHSTYAGIDPATFLPPRLIKYNSYDSLEIPAFLYLPANYKGGAVPFVIHVHGGPESQFRPYFQRNFQYLLQSGYGLLAPNIRGSSGYGQKYQGLDNYKNRMNSIKDIKAGVDYLIRNGYTSPGMIGIRGASYGGYAVLASITEYPDLFSAAVDEVGIANFVTFLTNTKDYRRHLREAEYGPLNDTTFLNSISPLYKADRIKAPLLVIHGLNDPRVPISEARQIIEAVRNNGGIVDSLIFPDEGHGISKQSNNILVYQKMIQFFDKYLKKE